MFHKNLHFVHTTELINDSKYIVYKYKKMFEKSLF